MKVKVQTKGIKFKKGVNTYFLRLQPGAWYGWIFYYKDNAWVAGKEATHRELLEILEKKVTLDFI